MLRLDHKSNGRTIALHSGDTFAIDLSENPTTGYTWHFEDLASRVCTQVSDRFELKTSPTLGGGGNHHWVFRATVSGAGTLRMQYSRGAPSSGAPRSFSLILEVT